jgi:hypothetical protein
MIDSMPIFNRLLDFFDYHIDTGIMADVKDKSNSVIRAVTE